MKLNLIAISYKNIGPFKGKILSLFFKKGNYLVKAPIGTGKSFLFFDGPSYALYKTSSRNILNIQSESGFVKLLFQVDGETFFITRVLRPGKIKDSTISHLYRCDFEEKDFFKNFCEGELLVYDMDIEKQLKDRGVIHEEIVFKNETDLQQHMGDLLPPQEVFHSTIFLLQDSGNIFEMQPAERLEVLKNVFGLLGIDESKEAVRDKRNEIKFQIKASQDFSQYEEKLQRYLGEMLKNYFVLERNQLSGKEVAGLKVQMDNYSGFKDKLSINNFVLDDDLLFFKPVLELKLKKIQEEFQQEKATLMAYQDQKDGLNQQLFSLDKEQENKKGRLLTITKKLDEINLDYLKELKGKKRVFQESQENLEKVAETERCENFYRANKDFLGLQERSSFSLRVNHYFIQELIGFGISLKSNSDFLDKQIEHLKSKAALEYDTVKSQIEALEEKKLFYSEQMRRLEGKILDFEKQVHMEENFECEKIDGKCPFIRVINKHHFEERKKEKDELIREKQILEAQVSGEGFEKKIEELKKKLAVNVFLDEEKELEEKKKRNQESMDKIRDFLQSFDYKKIEELFNQCESNEKELRSIEIKIQEQEELQSHQEKYQQEKFEIEAAIKQFDEQRISIGGQLQEIELKIKGIQEKLQYEPKQELLEVQEALDLYSKNIEFLGVLIDDFKAMQINLKTLVEEEKYLGVLYGILNKELLLFVLGSYLPVLTEIVNSYLASVVDYQISIKLVERGEKLELETKVIDEKGEREIKSLSGGQKTILKLVWMLAISSYMKTDMLFLDETVNNLDVETVGRVAQMLDNFVKQRDMKFYTITHNSEIQAMKIWDKILEIKNVGN